MEKIRLGIIGFGNMGTAHAKNVRTGLVPKMELSAICDILPERLELARELYPEVSLYDNATELYKSGKCDLVIIAVPHYDHSALVIEAR